MKAIALLVLAKDYKVFLIKIFHEAAVARLQLPLTSRACCIAGILQCPAWN